MTPELEVRPSRRGRPVVARKIVPCAFRLEHAHALAVLSERLDISQGTIIRQAVERTLREAGLVE